MLQCAAYVPAQRFDELLMYRVAEVVLQPLIWGQLDEFTWRADQVEQGCQSVCAWLTKARSSSCRVGCTLTRASTTVDRIIRQPLRLGCAE